MNRDLNNMIYQSNIQLFRLLYTRRLEIKSIVHLYKPGSFQRVQALQTNVC